MKIPSLAGRRSRVRRKVSISQDTDPLSCITKIAVKKILSSLFHFFPKRIHGALGSLDPSGVTVCKAYGTLTRSPTAPTKRLYWVAR